MGWVSWTPLGRQVAEQEGLEGQLSSLSGLVRGGVASIDPGWEFVGSSCFSPNMKLMGQSLADWGGTCGARILRSSAPDRADVSSQLGINWQGGLQSLLGKGVVFGNFLGSGPWTPGVA